MNKSFDTNVQVSDKTHFTYLTQTSFFFWSLFSVCSKIHPLLSHIEMTRNILTNMHQLVTFLSNIVEKYTNSGAVKSSLQFFFSSPKYMRTLPYFPNTLMFWKHTCFRNSTLGDWSSSTTYWNSALWELWSAAHLRTTAHATSSVSYWCRRTR